MSEEERESQRDDALLEKHALALGEMFDTVQIFATRYDGSKGATLDQAYGAGNIFAIEGQVRSWLMKRDTILKEEVRLNVQDELLDE